MLGALQSNVSSPDAAATVVIDVSSLVDYATRQPPAQGPPASVRGQLSQILAVLAPPGMDADVDAACKEAFNGGESGKVAWGLIRYVASS